MKQDAPQPPAQCARCGAANVRLIRGGTKAEPVYKCRYGHACSRRQQQAHRKEARA